MARLLVEIKSDREEITAKLVTKADANVKEIKADKKTQTDFVTFQTDYN